MRSVIGNSVGLPKVAHDEEKMSLLAWVGVGVGVGLGLGVGVGVGIGIGLGLGLGLGLVIVCPRRLTLTVFSKPSVVETRSGTW